MGPAATQTMKECFLVPRLARLKSQSGVYHVMWRGIDRQNIFLDDEDRQKFLETLSGVKLRSNLQIYAYCLMSNHVHFLVAEKDEPLGLAMKRLGSSYVQRYNLQHDRIGHLFQGRYVSEPVETDRYLLAAIRYIHQNPVKAGLTDCCANYRWSSYQAYLSGSDAGAGLTDIHFALNVAGGLQPFLTYHDESNADEFADVGAIERISDADLRMMLEKLLQGFPVVMMGQLEPHQRIRVLGQAKAISGASLRQIARVTGLNKTAVERACLRA